MTYKELEGALDDNISVSSIILQLRALTQKDFSFFKAHKIYFLGKINESELLEENNSENTRRCSLDDFSNFLCLLSHKSEDLMSSIWNLVLSFFLLECLTYSGWLPASSLTSELTDDEEYLTLLLVHLRGVTQFNTHKIAEMLSCEGGLLKSQEVGIAVRPTAALLNHSCWPNTVRCSTGNNVVIMASFTIQPGDEVTDIYTETFHEMSTEYRQAKCRSYKFTCTCQACKEDWPLLQDLPSALSKTKRSMFVKHMSLPMVIKLGEDLNQVDAEARELFAAGQTRQALAKWSEMCQLAEKRIRHPSRIFIIVRERIQACLWRLYGASRQKL